MAIEPKKGADGEAKKAPVDYTKVRVLQDEEAEKFERLLVDLQVRIRRVKREYELWFYGTADRPPYESRNELDNHVRRIRNKTPKGAVNQFKLGNILSMYQQLVELWDKTQRKMEEGGRAVWMAAAHRSPLEELQDANERRQEEARQAARKAKSAYVARIQSPDGDDAEFRKVFNSYCAARKKVGESGEASYEKFKASLAKQTRGLIGSGKATAVAYRVEVKEGKVSIKAKAEK